MREIIETTQKRASPITELVNNVDNFREDLDLNKYIVVGSGNSTTEQEVVNLVVRLFSYRKQLKELGNTYHKETLLIRKTKTEMEIHLDLNKHQKPMYKGQKVFYAEKDGTGNNWIVSWFQSGIWIMELNKIVSSYRPRCTGEINDENYFRYAS
jgi:hypothetical protein